MKRFKRKWFILSLVLLTVIVMALSATYIVQKGNLHSVIETNANGTMSVMWSRTPYPTSTQYPSQTPYFLHTDNSITTKNRTLYSTPSLYPTSTPYPTDYRASVPTLRSEVLNWYGIQSRDLSKYGRCGDKFEVGIGPRQPYLTFGIENEKASDRFLIVNLTIINVSDITIRNIFHKQFFIRAKLDGADVKFVSYNPAGQGAANEWGTHYVTNIGLPPDVPVDTWLGFDVDPRATDWSLVFISDEDSGLDCSFEVPLPGVINGAAFETLQVNMETAYAETKTAAPL